MASYSGLYRPLVEADAIRILALHPSSTYSAELRGSLFETTVSECDSDKIDSFNALSYVWGNPTKAKTIEINGKATLITTLLDLALRDLRDTNRVLRLWVDALCIDQSNTEERNQQVSFMGDIYATAQHTIIHLGPSSLEAESVLRKLMSKAAGKRQLDYVIHDVLSEEEIQLVDDHILSRPWFRRVWVLQELVLSKDPWIRCGKVEMRWDDFCLPLRRILQNRRERYSPLASAITDSWTLLQGMNVIRAEALHAKFPCGTPDDELDDRTLLGILRLRRGLGATDARDLVFAHLGLASDFLTSQIFDHTFSKKEKLHYIPVNYQASCVQVFSCGNELDKIVELSHVLQDAEISDDTTRDIVRQGLETLALLSGNTQHYVVPEHFSNKNEHEHQLLEISDVLIKGLSEGSEPSQSSEAFMPSLSEMLSRNAQLRDMLASRWKTPDRSGCYGLLLAYIIQHLGHVSGLSKAGKINTAPPPYLERGSSLSYRRLAKTSRGLFGFVPASARIGDGVTFLNSCMVPIITRGVVYEDTDGLDSRVRIRFRSAQQEGENNKRSHIGSPRPISIEQEHYMVQGSITASAVKHVIVLGMSFFDGIALWNGREDQKWTDIYAIH
ncbi:hypothetical protein GLAREA_03572 [Glarea lozoyensis ATCC 20868]|uniref:Heterokaryon incompatibility domain-containing protein n=1 Tax=Glarea lozoyensis (strain ATCC 20868 / MF5171) TaxID=1116229 RepID=S3CYB3_GLAL2|nr:uncharacterized protein GLAREA_03572 [Glarea lozoyensis ATCC 20868]EPE30605.1 hypothetical protein GLAREA_03572 [Glarea lozoyensis ATCC 20868]